jgi:hypothetical protein
MNQFEGDLEFYGIDRAVANAYTNSLREHIACVQEAGQRIGVPVAQLEVHDLSKWSEAEFPGYAKHFKGGGAPDEFAKAWLHHIHLNSHHWEHWIFSDGFTPKGSTVENGVVQMPPLYILEMVADWMGASRAYTGSWDMADWLSNHIPKIKVHSKTAEILRGILDGLGYADVVYMRKFARE